VIFGPRSASELIANLEDFTSPVDPELWRALKNDKLVDPAAPTP
jgi:hypothetical protein